MQRPPQIIKSGTDAQARARLLAHFVDNPKGVFYNRQLEVLYENEYFHWVTNRALRDLVLEGKIATEDRMLDHGSAIKLMWNKSYRFYKRDADEVVALVNAYTAAATDGALGMQGEALTLAAFARNRFVLYAEESREYRGKVWDETEHDLDFIFERDGVGYGIEVKNTLGYIENDEFVTKIRLARAIGVRPIFVVRALPNSWIQALAKAGGFALIMRWQFYPWTHTDLAKLVREKLGLYVDTPKRIEAGTMVRLEEWIKDPAKFVEPDSEKVSKLLAKILEANKRFRDVDQEDGESGSW